jgi:hypothetical protein
MNSKLLLAALLFSSSATCFAQTYSFPRIRVTVHVVGEDRQPVSGADATFVFNEGPVGFGKMKEVPVVTDEKGNFTAEGFSETGTVGFVRRSIHKDGYYEAASTPGHSMKYRTVAGNRGTKPTPQYCGR